MKDPISPRATRFGRVTFYHPNPRGTGAAVQFELRLNQPNESRYDCVFMELAAQKSAAQRTADTLKPATFDWPARITVKLDFCDLAELLLVLEGRSASAGPKGRGLYHQSAGGNTIIGLALAEEGGYQLGVSRKGADQAEPQKLRLCLTPAEALGLRVMFLAALEQIALRPHPNSKGESREEIPHA